MGRALKRRLDDVGRVNTAAALIAALVSLVTRFVAHLPWWWLLWILPMAFLIWAKGLMEVLKFWPKPDWNVDKAVIHLGTRHLRKGRLTRKHIEDVSSMIDRFKTFNDESRRLWREVEQAIVSGRLRMWVRSAPSPEAPLYALDGEFIRDYEIRDKDGPMARMIEFDHLVGYPTPEVFIRSVDPEFVPRIDGILAEGKKYYDPHFSSLQMHLLWPPRDWWELWKR